MPKTPDPERTDAQTFLRFLKEEGIGEFFLNPRSPVLPIQNAPALSARTAASSSKTESADLQNLSTRDAMMELRSLTLTCTKCHELASTRTQVVFGAGNVKAQLMFVGEAPGQEEDNQGLPFVGRAGQLLTKIIESIGLDRKEVFIANVLKCRPPQNRAPLPDEVANCKPFLMRQIEIIRPKIICCLGTHAAHAILDTDTPISQLRGNFRPFASSQLICTYHPAYLLRNPSEKAKVWEDMKKIRKALAEGT